MSDHSFKPGLNEALSAFLDGEASPEEMHALLDELERNPQLHSTVDHHHQLRARLRGEWHPGLDAGFADRVLASIGMAEAGGDKTSKVVSMPTRRAWVRSGLGLAMAASLAGIVVIAAQVLQSPADPARPTLTARIDDVRTAAVVQPPQRDAEVAVRSPGSQKPWNDLSPDAAAELSNYLISHNNSAMGHGLGGSMGFMRVAARDGVAFRGNER